VTKFINKNQTVIATIFLHKIKTTKVLLKKHTIISIIVQVIYFRIY